MAVNTYEVGQTITTVSPYVTLDLPGATTTPISAVTEFGVLPYTVTIGDGDVWTLTANPYVTTDDASHRTTLTMFTLPISSVYPSYEVFYSATVISGPVGVPFSVDQQDGTSSSAWWTILTITEPLSTTYYNVTVLWDGHTLTGSSTTSVTASSRSNTTTAPWSVAPSIATVTSTATSTTSAIIAPVPKQRHSSAHLVLETSLPIVFGIMIAACMGMLIWLRHRRLRQAKRRLYGNGSEAGPDDRGDGVLPDRKLIQELHDGPLVEKEGDTPVLQEADTRRAYVV